MQCTANVIAIGQWWCSLFLFHYDYESLFSRSYVNSSGTTTTTTTKTKLNDWPILKWILSVHEQFKSIESTLDVKRSVCTHLDSIDGVKKRQFAQLCEWFGIGHHGRGFEDIREPRRWICGGLYELFDGEEEGCNFSDMGERAAVVVERER